MGKSPRLRHSSGTLKRTDTHSLDSFKIIHIVRRKAVEHTARHHDEKGMGLPLCL
jgi:hypothetical protein